ncbi:MAG: glutamine synthetase family protein [Polyangiaceae bacterium]
MMSAHALTTELLERGIDTVEIGFADTQGTLRGKRIPLSQLPRVADEGLSFCLGALGWDIEGTVFPTDVVSWDNGYPDVVALPDLGSLRSVPWRQGTALVLADIVDCARCPVAVGTRGVLKRVLAQAEALGLIPVVGAELEFYVFDEQLRPIYEGTQAYSLGHAGRLEPFFRDLRGKLESLGIAVEASHSEYGPAQSEVNLVYADALKAADQALLFKYAVKEVARLHGLRASFMAKPWEDQSGCGFHLHVSFRGTTDARNRFEVAPELGRHAIAGMLATLRDFAALWAPTVNSFKRVREDAFVPTTQSWGGDNRTVAVRALLDRGQGSRVELRTGAADANPYVAIAAAIAGALHGIVGKLEPPAAASGNAARDRSLLPLPRDLREALSALERSAIAPEYFEPAFLRHYATTCRYDLSVHDRVVTDWERRRYLENA